MDQRDKKLDSMLDLLRRDKPTNFEMRRWQIAMEGLSAKRPLKSIIWPILAASAAGALLSLAAVRFIGREIPVCNNARSQDLVMENDDVDATIELTYIKLD